MLNRLILLVFLSVSGAALADDDLCGRHTALGVPSGSDVVLCKGAFAVGFNKTTRTPDWAAYYITRQSVGAKYERTDKFIPDNEVDPADQAYLSDYTRSGYDRGHLAPAATIDVTLEALKESFELTNIAPQLPGLNRQGWAELESAMRGLAVRFGSVYIITGTHGIAPKSMGRSKAFKAVQLDAWQGDQQFYQTERPAGGHLNNRVAIPAAFYKAFIIPELGVAGAFYVPHEDISKTKIYSYYVSIDELERIIGIDLFDALPMETAEALESTKDLSLFAAGIAYSKR